MKIIKFCFSVKMYDSLLESTMINFPFLLFSEMKFWPKLSKIWTLPSSYGSIDSVCFIMIQPEHYLVECIHKRLWMLDSFIILTAQMKKKNVLKKAIKPSLISLTRMTANIQIKWSLIFLTRIAHRIASRVSAHLKKGKRCCQTMWTRNGSFIA